MNEDNISIYAHCNADGHLRQIFTVNVFGKRVYTTVTCRSSVVRKWIYKIRFQHRLKRHRLVVGLGVQWRPNLSYRVAATLQLCVGRQCLVFQIINANNIPRILRRFLSDHLTTFVGVRNYVDSGMLSKDFNLYVNRIVELGSMANIRGASMETMASDILGFHEIKKPEFIGRSRWDDRRLTDHQVQYACVDSNLSFEIGKKLKAWNYRP
ncbi:Werner syndrome ATP-dependent helicase homolog [Telopea speciosissima]|uniref:Werner syndrome ATP-dependent helicase homolog n=1 Tax=Telopea speciosissima TaxID=54955 RepID=UPI001CC7AF40|nr:Werner syndrome ATP-dependent helicase homolog [Telopea speciosissima]